MLRIRLFGASALELDGAPLALNAPPRTWPLWAYLLLQRDRALPRDAVARAIWPDAPESGARANLRRHLWHLQRALPPAPPDRPWAIVSGEHLRWNPEAPAWLDVAEFERLAADPEGLEAAIALYRGDLLEGLHDEWVFAERERLRVRFLDALDTLVARYRVAGDAAGAIRHAAHLLSLDPLRETTLRQLMALHYESGDRARALAVFREFAQRLRAELGVAPMPETMALHAAIVRNAPLPGLGGVPEAAAPTSGAPTALGAAGAGAGVGGRPPSALAGAMGACFPFVGRDALLAEARAAWAVAAAGRGGALFISGEAGIGKSRFAAELARWAEREGGRVLGGSTAFGEPVPYQSLVEALRSALPLLQVASLGPRQRAALAPLLPELKGLGEALPALPALDPVRERQRLFDAVVQALAALASPRPLLLVLEDLHWAGAATIDLLGELPQELADRAVLVAITYREEETLRSHPLRELRRRLQATGRLKHVPLGPLDRADLVALLARASGSDRVAEAVAEPLYRESAGNPFFVGELLRAWIEAGLIEADAGGWRIARALGGRLPGGVQAVIESRLARLSPEARTVAEVAAAIGPAFEIDLVREVVGWSEEATLDALDELLDRQIVREPAGLRRGDYTFAHHLIQTTLERLTDAPLRRRRHRRIARVLEELYPERLDDLAARLAHHFDRGEEAARAAAYYLQAARRAEAVFAHGEALAAVERGLALDPEPRLRFALLALRETMHERLGDPAAQAADLETLAQLAAGIDDDDLLCDALQRRFWYHHMRGEREPEGRLLGALAERAERLADPRWRAEAARAAAYYSAVLGDFTAACAAAERARSLFHALGDLDREVDCLAAQIEWTSHGSHFAEAPALIEEARRLAGPDANPSRVFHLLTAAHTAATVPHRWATSYALARELLAFVREHGVPAWEAPAHLRLGLSATQFWRIAEAREHHAHALRITQRQGITRGVLSVRMNAAILSMFLGRYTEAIADLMKVADGFRTIGDFYRETSSLVLLAECAIQRADASLARASLAAAEAAVERTTSRLSWGMVYRLAGSVELAFGDPRLAVDHLRAAAEAAQGLGVVPVACEVLAELALAYLDAGQPPAARRAAEAALRAFTEAPDDIWFLHQLLWAAARVDQALGDTERARNRAEQAHELLHERARVIPDTESRASFLNTPANRALRAAHERAIWP